MKAIFGLIMQLLRGASLDKRADKHRKATEAEREAREEALKAREEGRLRDVDGPANDGT